MATLAHVCSLCGNAVTLQDCKIDEYGEPVHASCYAKIRSANNGALRPWRQIARELATEHNSKRILELSLELNKAMAAQGMNVDPEISGHEKASDYHAPHGEPRR